MEINLKSYVNLIWMSALTVILAFHLIRQPETPSVPEDPAGAPVGPIAAGKAYAPTLAQTYANAWDAAASSLEGGSTVSQSQEVLQSSWQAARRAAFAVKVTPTMKQILPEGTEPETPEMRKAVAESWRRFAKGLRAGK